MRLRSTARTALPWAILAFCVAAGLLTDIFRMTQAEIAGFAAVILLFGSAFFARFGRVGFSRKFPFIRLRFVLPSADH